MDAAASAQLTLSALSLKLVLFYSSKVLLDNLKKNQEAKFALGCNSVVTLIVKYHNKCFSEKKLPQ